MACPAVFGGIRDLDGTAISRLAYGLARPRCGPGVDRELFAVSNSASACCTTHASSDFVPQLGSLAKGCFKQALLARFLNLPR